MTIQFQSTLDEYVEVKLRKLRAEDDAWRKAHPEINEDDDDDDDDDEAEPYDNTVDMKAYIVWAYDRNNRIRENDR